MPELAAGEHLGPLFGGVLEPALQRVHADLLRQNIEHTLHREGTERRARHAIGRDLRATTDHVVTDRARIRDVVGSKRAHARAHERRPRECAGPSAATIVEDNEPQCVGGRTIAQCKLSFVAFGTPNGLILRWRSIELSSQPLSKQ